MGPSVEQQLIDELEATLARQQAAVSEGHASIQDTIREMHAALRELESRESALTQTASSLTGQTAERLKAFQTALKESNGAGQAAAKELDAARARIAQLEEVAGNAPALKEQIASLEEQRVTLQGEVDRQAALLLEAEKAHKKLRKIEQAYKEQAEALQAGQAARRRVAELETTVNEYKQATQAEQQRVAELREKLDAAAARESKLTARVQELESQDTQRVADELATANTRLTESAHRIETLEADLDQARKEAARLEKNAQELDDEVATRGEAVQQAQARIESLELKNRDLAGELDELRGHARDTAESERKLRAQFDELQSKWMSAQDAAEHAANLESKLGPLTEEVSKLKQRAATLENDLQRERAKGTKSQLATQLADALREREAAEEEIRTLKAKLDDRPATTRSMHADAEPALEIEETEVLAPDYEALEDARHMLGEIFLNAGAISKEQLDHALSVQQSERPVRRLGEILVSLGHMKEIEVAQAVARQRGLKFLKLESGSIDTKAARLISGRLAEMHMCIPVREHGDELVVAMENPLDLIAIEDVERASERRVRPAVATISAIQAAISKIYSADRQRV